MASMPAMWAMKISSRLELRRVLASKFVPPLPGPRCG